MTERFMTFLWAEEWSIWAWESKSKRVIEFNTELWGEWGYHHESDDVAVMAEHLEQHKPRVLSESETARFWADLEESFPGITNTTRR